MQSVSIFNNSSFAGDNINGAVMVSGKLVNSILAGDGLESTLTLKFPPLDFNYIR